MSTTFALRWMLRVLLSIENLLLNLLNFPKYNQDLITTIPSTTTLNQMLLTFHLVKKESKKKPLNMTTDNMKSIKNFLKKEVIL
jgi:hypothetical protein